MATYRGTKPEQTGDVRKDVSRLFNALYDSDEELRYLFGHIDTENLTDHTYAVIADKIFDDDRFERYLTEKDYDLLREKIDAKYGADDVIPIANGGTGAITKNSAANNLCEVGSWTPTFECYDDSGNTTTAPTVTTGWKDAYYIRFGHLCYIYMDAAIGISNIGGGYAQIGGLPFDSYPLGYQGDTCQYVYQCLTNSSQTEPVRAVIGSNAPNKVRLRDVNNVGPYQWKVNTSVGTNAGRLYFAFMYRIGD